MNVSIAPLVCLLALLAPAAQAAPAKKSAHPATSPKSVTAAPAANPRVALQTNKGRIVIELYADKAPITVKNFLDYVDERLLRRHHLPPRHPRLHDPGGRLHARTRPRSRPGRRSRTRRTTA